MLTHLALVVPVDSAVPLLKARLAAPVAFAADTASITVMEITNNAVMLVIPGAIEAELTDPVFWASLVLAFGVGFVAAWPVNRWLIARGRGHAVMIGHH